MFYLGYVMGFLISILSLCLGFYLARTSQSAEIPLSPAPGGIFSFTGGKKKKTPKSPSEFDEWKKEQSQAPRDPLSRHLE